MAIIDEDSGQLNRAIKDYAQAYELAKSQRTNPSVFVWW
jgi:hypothetical protein